jgi:hypothetical protein
VQVGAALVYPVALVAAVGCVLLLAAYVFSLPMLVPAVACEGTDAIDAAQRCFAYALARPLRLALYLAVVVVQGVLLTLVIAALLNAAVQACAWVATAWADPAAREYLRDAALRTAEATSDTPGSRVLAGRLIAFWSGLPAALLAALGVSYWFSSGTVLYLAMRQVCDGQDIGELWTPGPPPAPVATDVPEAEDADYE